MRVRTVGFANQGRPHDHDLPEGSTVEDVCGPAGISSKDCTFMVNGQNADACTTLTDGACVTYSQINIKGA